MISSLYFLGGAGKYKYEAERLITAFFPSERIELCFDSEPKGDGWVSLYADDESLQAVLSDGDRKQLSLPSSKDGGRDELLLCGLMYDLLKEHTGISMPWGILTGVRPVKVIRAAYDKYRDRAGEYIFDVLRVSKERQATANKIISAQRGALERLGKNSVSLYVSIPFCPTRCSYCSFISSAGNALKLKGEYLKLLLCELDIYRELIHDCGLTVSTVYIGGGTPTVLEPDELSLLLDGLARFDLSSVIEFTAEAGRPDTITEEKLRALKRGGVTRISINPQTFNDDVLKNIGRAHTAKQVYNAFSLARQCGFDNINTDIIAGLPGDDTDSFHDTLERLRELSPENVTVHTLSLKRSSTLFYKREKANISGAAAMVEDAARLLESTGYYPYYMYRQKNIADNLENVGYCKPGRECFYNIYMMEELQSIIAAGCAASSKLVDGGGIRRIVNYKYPFEYISGFDKMLDGRVEQLRKFFTRNG